MAIQMAQMKERRLGQLMESDLEQMMELPKVTMLVHLREEQMAMQMALMKETSLVCQWDCGMETPKAWMRAMN